MTRNLAGIAPRNALKPALARGAAGIVAVVARSLAVDHERDIVALAFRPFTYWAARRAIAGRNRVRGGAVSGRFVPSDVDHFLRQAWQRYDELSVSLPPQPTRGSRMNLRLAALTDAMLGVLVDAGVERQYAVELIADTSWKIYEVWGRLGAIAALLRPSGDETLAFARTYSDGSVRLTFPFEAPGYVVRPAEPSCDSEVAFDVVHCPVAEYFRARGEVDLCRAAWCDLDYPLADLRGCTLKRSTTLVEGADRCDFRVQRGFAQHLRSSAVGGWAQPWGADALAGQESVKAR
jgi:hypothetical protein